MESKYLVLTPAGVIKVDSAEKALEYKLLYGYPYTHYNENNNERNHSTT